MNAGVKRYLFVYGSLRRGSGHAMADWLAGQARWCGSGWVQGQLFRVAWYPGMTEGSGSVRGDVYALDKAGIDAVLAALDAFEECHGREDDEYRRGPARVVLDDTMELMADVYWYQGNTTGLDPLPGGDWLEA